VPTVQASYLQAVNALTPLLYDLPGKVVAIDGRDGVGKTTLGRYLAWVFNISLIETDLFMIEGTGSVERWTTDIDRIVRLRLRKPRPVIVEGVMLLELFETIERQPDFLIYAEMAQHSTGEAMECLLNAYEARFDPRGRANLVVSLEP